MTASYVMKVSRNGQVSIPASARSRWGGADRVVVVDLDDHVVVRPLPDDPVRDLRGKYPTGPTTREARDRARADDAEHERRKRR